VSPYGIIIVLFTLAGLVMAGWGWRMIARGRRTLAWPSVEGVIEESRLASEEDDTLPKIVFSYTVAEHRYRCDTKLPGDAALSPDLAESRVNKYPAGRQVRVHYNPLQPDQATLEPGPARDDWLIFSLGLAAAVLGLGFLIFK
jgi:hypothetical protein